MLIVIKCHPNGWFKTHFLELASSWWHCRSSQTSTTTTWDSNTTFPRQSCNCCR